MTEQETVVTTGGDGQAVQGQPATTQVQEGSTIQQGSQDTQGQATEQGTTTQSDEVRQVPLSALKAIEAKFKATNEANQKLQDQINQAKMIQKVGGFNPPPQNVQPTVTPQPQPQPKPNIFDGYQDTDLLDVGTMKKMVEVLQPQQPDLSEALKPVNDTLALMQVQIQDPNYEQTIRTYLPDIITTQPIIVEMIKRSPNPVLAALSVAKMTPRYVQDQQNMANQTTQQQPEENPLDMLKKIIDNSTIPASPASMGGSGAVQGFDRFKDMSDADLVAEIERVKGMGR
jgi:hypothetical protein